MPFGAQPPWPSPPRTGTAPSNSWSLPGRAAGNSGPYPSISEEVHTPENKVANLGVFFSGRKHVTERPLQCEDLPHIHQQKTTLRLRLFPENHSQNHKTKPETPVSASGHTSPRPHAYENSAGPAAPARPPRTPHSVSASDRPSAPPPPEPLRYVQLPLHSGPSKTEHVPPPAPPAPPSGPAHGTALRSPPRSHVHTGRQSPHRKGLPSPAPSMKVVRMSSSKRRNRQPSLRKARRVLRVRMHHPANPRKLAIEQRMRLQV